MEELRPGRMQRMATAVAVVCAVALGAGCSGQPEGASAATSAAAAVSGPAFEDPFRHDGVPDDPPAALTEFYRARVLWRDCADDRGFSCARVRVPVDYAKPDGPTVEIALRRLAATRPEKRKGTIFVNPGGPGVSGVEFVAESPMSPRVTEQWDVVGFDPRGIGDSGGFTCLTDRELDEAHAADPTPPDRAGRKRLLAEVRARVENCHRRGGVLAAHMGSEDVARDLDVLRSAVGDDRLSYYGASYGTLIGALYAQQFPSRVGLMVLDSAFNPSSFAGGSVMPGQVDADAELMARAFDAQFDEFVTWCAARQDCPIDGDPAAAATALIGLLDELERRPMPADVARAPALSEGWAVTALQRALPRRELWPVLGEGLAAALQDADGTGLLEAAARAVHRQPDGAYAQTSWDRNHLPVSCADWPAEGEPPAPSQTILQDHPLWARVQPLSMSECAAWPGPVRTNLFVRSEPRAPVLVIGNEKDTVTPFEGTAYLSGTITNARLVMARGRQGHGAYRADNTCMDVVVDAYFTQSRLPAAGTMC